jgi:hypothetical protein
MPNVYDTGDVARVSCTFTNPAGAFADPTTVRAKYKAPGQATVTKTYLVDSEVIRDSAGKFHMDMALTLAGTWRYRWEGEGTIVAAGEGAFMVDPTGV